MTALRKYAGMSDDQLENERDSKRRLFAAVAALRSEIIRTNFSSSVVKISLEAFEAFIHDELPSSEGWDEKIAEARRG